MCGISGYLKKNLLAKETLRYKNYFLMKLDTEVLLAAKHLYRRITLPHVLA